MKGLQHTCEAIDKAMKQFQDQHGANPGSKNILVQELNDISSHLAEKSSKLMQSEERARIEGGNFSRFAKVMNDHPNTARSRNSQHSKVMEFPTRQVSQGNSLGNLKYTSEPQFSDSSKR